MKENQYLYSNNLLGSPITVLSPLCKFFLQRNGVKPSFPCSIDFDPSIYLPLINCKPWQLDCSLNLVNSLEMYSSSSSRKNDFFPIKEFVTACFSELASLRERPVNSKSKTLWSSSRRWCVALRGPSLARWAFSCDGEQCGCLVSLIHYAHTQCTHLDTVVTS